MNWNLWLGAALGWILLAQALAAEPCVRLRGVDFEGGAQRHFGSSHYLRSDVNYVYAQANGPAATMTASFGLGAVPRRPLFLLLEAMDDDSTNPCRIRITLNGQQVFEGPSGFPDARWMTRRFAIPPHALRVGTNQLAIVNQEPAGGLGAPPWFMVARGAIADARYQLPAVQPPAFQVRLPRRVRPLPEPLPAGRSKPGFKLRGTKGWFWTPEQYLAEVPTLKRLNLNFLMNCYSSMFSSAPGEPWRNEWWKPMTPEKQAAYARVFRACDAQGITFCFAVHPQLASPRPLDPTRTEDIDQFYQHYAWAQSQGVHWFSVSLDDVSWGTKGPGAGGAEHAHLVNTVFGRLRQRDPAAQLIFCPVPYWGDGSNAEHHAYLDALAREMHPDVYVFWTGDAVVTQRITRQAAERYRHAVKHRLFLWDNYPVNDASPTLHLGPVSGRDSDLGEVIDGYMSNPLATQNEINRIPLATCADYAFNPWAYDPGRSIGQAILHFASTRAQRQVLKDLVEAYPGFIVTGGGTGTNPVRARYTALAASPESARAAQVFLRGQQDLLARLAREFPEAFAATRKTLADDLAWMQSQKTAR